MSRIPEYLSRVHLPEPDSHKGQNGKVLLIGGSELFHAASKWSLDVVSKFVDMVFYASVPSNNELIQAAKGEFWNGIVIERDDMQFYLEQADVILIGPGMTRTPDTEEIINTLLREYPDKKWVIDAGALQMMDVSLLNKSCIITPHHGELQMVWQRAFNRPLPDDQLEAVIQLSQKLGHVTVLLKGREDIVAQGEKTEVIEGGNAGMTKGGTGDVLAGLVAGLFVTEEAFAAAVLASYINKRAGDDLYEEVGPFFNASDLVDQIPKTLWHSLQKTNGKW